MMRNVFVLVATGLLILLFVYTAISKLIDFDTFAGEMRNQPLPAILTGGLIGIVPTAELVIALMLIVPRWRVGGMLLATIVLFVFTLYVILILGNTFSYVPCSCAGIFKTMSWKTHLFVNLFFTGLSAAAFYVLRFEQRDV